ncbi:hypothetical protein [Psychroserpens sp.]|uniref:hypothetical protein n=1 Tax=Psychroserpens sp. TaxID=2020870 RepID=UPI001B15845F|nr:hypothetical protein [Psychroserpens sp.]MBO6607436.1 hypothetical protein [Psychroserpens sp.]MBO6632880.1 hypothetical protein [Psychroserpens sp.]MBO6654486.1 hypothetical protein [Psychroserpens sp.]MBO6681165.1 hypothetical protein [Psychroserpens sp.]MBO6749878.1 hypothetical protein [Psychroserpens sp.]
MKTLKHTFIILFTLLSLSCVQERHSKTITFKVDMRQIETVNNVGIRGNFTEDSWNETIPMLDNNGDGIYETTITRETAFNAMQFKFVNQESDFELKDADNRILEFEYKPEVITYEAKFNSPESIITKQ